MHPRRPLDLEVHLHTVQVDVHFQGFVGRRVLVARRAFTSRQAPETKALAGRCPYGRAVPPASFASPLETRVERCGANITAVRVVILASFAPQEHKCARQPRRVV